ncbi:hypothetical protein [Lentzea sp. NPDC060358]|uniref:hypothetical protein n=1 Tax=Lentzea sp. NPDC060358 TaxID=3347103 RepID=UPI00366284C7
MDTTSTGNGDVNSAIDVGPRDRRMPRQVALVATLVANAGIGLGTTTPGPAAPADTIAATTSGWERPGLSEGRRAELVRRSPHPRAEK